MSAASQQDLPVLQKLFREMFELYREDHIVEYPSTQAGIEYLERCIAAGDGVLAREEGRPA